MNPVWKTKNRAAKLEEVLNEILDLDDNKYLHRDLLDTNKVFEKARKLLRRKRKP